LLPVSLFSSMADLPSGAITFLFTDIEGSTRLLKQLRERYAEVLAEHQRLLRTAFAAHEGHEVDTQGDSFFVAFASARDALLAAIEGQLAVLSHPWPEGVQIKVRMGLHTGQAVAASGRYTGLAVHRAARIGAAGHGGQILVSQATQTLLEDEEEDLHVFFRDLGEQQLKDLDRPVRLYQTAADGLPDSFPPIRREAELAQAAEAAIAVPLWRRPAALAAAVLGLAGVLAAAAFLVTRDSARGLGGVRPNNVGLIDPKTNEIVAEVSVGIRPGPVAAGAGLVWVGNLQDRSLTRIDARQRSAVATISLDNRTPTGIAVGEGAVWVAHGARGELSRVDPQFGQVTTIRHVAGVSNVAGLSNRGSVTVGSGWVWAVYGDSTLARIDPQRVKLAGKTFTAETPTGVAYGANSVWVANGYEAEVWRYNPSTFDEGAVDEKGVGRRPGGIAYGADAIWVSNTGEDSVTRIDPASGATDTIRGVGDSPIGIAVGGGAVWVASRDDGTVSRIDPATREVVKTIKTGNVPNSLAFGYGYVWVTVQAPAP
jgi:YVTN family beta-propeller protein